MGRGPIWGIHSLTFILSSLETSYYPKKMAEYYQRAMQCPKIKCQLMQACWRFQELCRRCIDARCYLHGYEEIFFSC